MGRDTNFNALAALLAEISQKDWNASKLWRPSLKMTPVANKTPSRFLNCVFEIEQPYMYFVNTKNIIQFSNFGSEITFFTMIIGKYWHFLAIFSLFLAKLLRFYILTQFFHRIMFIGFLSIINMGKHINIRVLAAL